MREQMEWKSLSKNAIESWRNIVREEPRVELSFVLKLMKMEENGKVREQKKSREY